MQISLIFLHHTSLKMSSNAMLDSVFLGLGTKATSGDSLSYHPCIILHRHKTGKNYILYALLFDHS